MERDGTLAPERPAGPLQLPTAREHRRTPATLDDPAVMLMTDLRILAPIIVRDTTPIDEALQGMIHSAVRFLFVVDRGQRLVGAVTSYDIQGEKPMLVLQALNCTLRTCSRSDIQVRDIMEPVEQWPVIRLSRVARARVGHVVSMLEGTGRRHLVVVANQPERVGETVVGMFSATHLERELGIVIGGERRAEQFVEIQRALAH